jgi:hypothetical protein
MRYRNAKTISIQLIFCFFWGLGLEQRFRLGPFESRNQGSNNLRSEIRDLRFEI